MSSTTTSAWFPRLDRATQPHSPTPEFSSSSSHRSPELHSPAPQGSKEVQTWWLRGPGDGISVDQGGIKLWSWVRSLAPLSLSWNVLDVLGNLSEPQFLHLQSRQGGSRLCHGAVGGSS
jgi:hypothetical protein